jgi:hypothetical protein
MAKESDVCNSTHLAGTLQLSPSSPLLAYSQYLCSVNWTAVGVEVVESNPAIQDYNEQVKQPGNHRLQRTGTDLCQINL